MQEALHCRSRKAKEQRHQYRPEGDTEDGTGGNIFCFSDQGTKAILRSQVSKPFHSRVYQFSAKQQHDAKGEYRPSKRVELQYDAEKNKKEAAVTVHAQHALGAPGKAQGFEQAKCPG